MIIGSVLLEPQRLARAGQIPAGDVMMDDIISLALCLLRDGVRGGRLSQRLGASLQGTLTRMTARAGAGVDRAATRFSTFFAPLVAPIQAAAAQPPGEVGELLDTLESGLKKAVGVLQGLAPEQMRQGMSTVFDILENDLGITPEFIKDAVLGVFDDMIEALQTALPGESTETRADRRELAALLGRLRRALGATFTFPAWNADAAAQAFLALLQRPEVDAALSRALCSGEAAVAWLRTGDTLVDLLPYSAFSFAEGTVGAAATPTVRDEVSFFASKLLEHDNYDGDLGTLPLQTLVDGGLTRELRDAFRNTSVVLASTAFLYTVDEEEWCVVDRKRYVITKVASKLWVYRDFVISLNDFLKAIQDDDEKHNDQRELRKIFSKNGIPLRGATLEVFHTVNSNTWEIQSGTLTFIGTKFEGDLTIRPKTLDGVLFTVPDTLLPAANEKAPAPLLRKAFEDNGIPLSPLCSLSNREPGSEWLLDDGDFEYTIKKDGQKLAVSTGGFGGALRAILSTLLSIPKGHMVWVNSERTQVLLGQRIMHTGSNVSWQDAPMFKQLNNGNRHYSLKNAPETLEGWTFHTSWAQDLVDIILHAVQIGLAADQDELEYSIASQILETGRLTSEMIVKLARHRPMEQLIRVGQGVWWYDVVLWLVTKLAGGIESAVKPSAPEEPGDPATTAGDGSKAVDTILSALAGVQIFDTHWSGLLREFLVSVVTLANHDEPAQAEHRPRNYKENGGFVDLFGKGGLLVYTAIIPDSEYALPFQTTSLTAGYWLGGATGVGLVMSFLGLLIGQRGIAGVGLTADGGHFAMTFVKVTGKSLLYFWPYLKLVKGKLD